MTDVLEKPDTQQTRMDAVTHPANPDDRTLVLVRELDASPEALFRCWAEDDLLKQWFVPRPWTIARVERDFRTGGAGTIVMADPEGNEYPNPGVYLEIVPDRKIVFTDAYTEAWRPSAKPFFTAVVEFEPLADGRTRYTATARHWTPEDREAHEKMGFHGGWNTCADQLEALAKTL